MTETSFSQANPAYAPHPDDPEVPETEVVEEFGNPEPVAEIVIEPDPEPNPADAPEEPDFPESVFPATPGEANVALDDEEPDEEPVEE